MEQPDLVSKYRASLKQGDAVKILTREPSENIPDSSDWKQAKVVSSSEQALTVIYVDGGQEVIPWNSGRICTSITS
ncbi:hypothetical protein [Phyllobacterium sp. YR531]|uniref:hypothetical protein n=1 Tax=Phyllobacterium sp. YR531 TaxID=1144343 RepID=UPI00026FB236|nr:hypothetical protein [Phyllobacterium sp. YR531]EJN04208.1 hypothetical protein PMI41_01847 [Phyllobacterium sp. YR531]